MELCAFLFKDLALRYVSRQKKYRRRNPLRWDLIQKVPLNTTKFAMDFFAEFPAFFLQASQKSTNINIFDLGTAWWGAGVGA